MAYITREDGERFVIPSYRDVLSAKKPSLLKKEILLLSADYGEYITLQRKSAAQYEVAFSPDTGYLLGETVWHHFKRPLDLVYCEAVPNTFEAILVIVKNGSVHLDGIFPVDSIPEELIVFRTQQNNFEIYIYGDVPIVRTPGEGVFAFDPASVKSFNVLEEPVFQKLPLVKAFQLQPVDTVLKAQRIGVFSLTPILVLVLLVVLLWLGYKYITSRPPPVVVVQPLIAPNPYAQYLSKLTSPGPGDEVRSLANIIPIFYSIEGWYPDAINYSNGLIKVSIRSQGARSNILFDWAARNNAKIDALSTGFVITMPMQNTPRQPPNTISPLSEIIANLTDRLSYVIQGNSLTIASTQKFGHYSEMQMSISFRDISPATLDLIGQQLMNLPLVLTQVNLTVIRGSLSGTIAVIALGN